jgi:uncharacterized membrane protein
MTNNKREKVFRANRTIQAPADAVWPLLANVVAWPTWLPTVTAVLPLDQTSLALGARFNVAQPRLRSTVWRVTSIQDGESFAWEARSTGLTMWANHSIRPVDTDSSDLLLEFRLSGVLAPVVSLMAGKLTNDYLQKEAASLQATIETAPVLF